MLQNTRHLKYKKLIRQLCMTQRQKDARLAWCKNYLEYKPSFWKNLSYFKRRSSILTAPMALPVTDTTYGLRRKCFLEDTKEGIL